MADPTKDELRRLLVDMTFLSEAFIVARGEKTPWMLEVEEEKIAQAAKARQASGLSAGPPKTHPGPEPATLAVLEKLAGVLKYFIEGDSTLAADTKASFKKHFAGVLTKGQLVLEPACDPTWDAAVPGDVSYKTLRQLGMHKGGAPLGIESLAQWVRSKTFGALMPTGELADNFLCLVKLLLWDPSLVGGTLEFSEMDCTITVNRVGVEDNVTSGDIRVRMGETYLVPTPGRRGLRSFVPSDTNVLQAVENIARKNKFHATREYLQGLRGTWDGTSRTELLLGAIGGVREIKGTDAEKEWLTKTNALALSQWTKTLVGTVARTFDPGCQMDTMLVLKSKQGTKKSSLFRALAPANRFSSATLEFGNKDSQMAMQQNTWIECAELSGMQKKEIQVVKAFITCRSDDFRLPYGKAITKNPRHCVMVGSTNDDTPLKDATGSRRFWIIVVDDEKQADIGLVTVIKDQVWAEAVALYDAATTCSNCVASVDGEPRCPTHRWWLSQEEEKVREQFNEQFTEPEPYIEWLEDWITNSVSDKNTAKQGLHAVHKNTDALRVHELLEAVGLPPEKCHDKAQQQRMSVALKRCGYVKRHTEKGNLWISPGMQGRPDLSLVAQPGRADGARAPEVNEKPGTGTGS